LTFKENVPDLRNSKVIDVIRELQEYGIDVQVTDAQADSAEAVREYGVSLTSYDELLPSEAVVLAVSHRKYIEAGWTQFDRLLKHGKGIVVDIKSELDKGTKPEKIDLWRL